MIIKVSGLHTELIPPELCVVSLSISHESIDQGEAYEAVSKATNGLLSGLRTASTSTSAAPAGTIKGWTISSLSTSSWVPWYDRQGGQEAPARQYRAASSATVTFKNFGKLSELCLEWSTTEYVSIDELDWRLTEATRNQTERSVRKEAYKRAAEKAEDYASARSSGDFVPNKLVCTEAEDFADKQSSAGPGGIQPMMLRSAKVGGGGDGEAIEMQPKDVEVTASVSCVFRYDE